jgi:hypothetical protein
MDSIGSRIDEMPTGDGEEETGKRAAVGKDSRNAVGGEGTVEGKRDMATTRALPSSPSHPRHYISDGLPPHITAVNTQTEMGSESGWKAWYRAFKVVLPVYVAMHLAFFLITCFATLFVVKDFSGQSLNVVNWLHSWSHWDANQYDGIAVYGYQQWWKTVFFPLFPLLQRGLMVVTGDALFAGLIISNVAGLGMLVVLYRLVEEDFDAERAYRTVLYLSIFPTAFFFAAAYTESLFLFLALFSFYAMRHGRWWMAGVFGLLAVLTRQAGLFLLVPFYCEYLRQRGDFNDLWSSSGNGIERLVRSLLRLDFLAGGLIVVGLGMFVVYCYYRFHILFPFSRAEGLYWNRDLHDPFWGMMRTVEVIAHSPGFLSFGALHNSLDLGQDLFVGVLIVLSIVGPWRFRGALWTYAVYGVMLYLCLQVYPVRDFSFPLQSVPRYMLEIFPAFIVLAGIGQGRRINLIYVVAAAALLFLLLTQYVTGHWIT